MFEACASSPASRGIALRGTRSDNPRQKQTLWEVGILRRAGISIKAAAEMDIGDLDHVLTEKKIATEQRFLVKSAWRKLFG